MYFERMVLMNLNGNVKKKRGREWINEYLSQFSINVFSAESGPRMCYKKQKP